MRLIITRYGETEENKAGIMMGHLHGTLSDVGIDQAKKVAERLKSEKIDYIYSSDLARAADTAKEIGKYHKKVPIEYVKDLRERNLGEFQGRKKSDFGWDIKDLVGTRVEPKTGETTEHMFQRAESFLKRVIRKHKHETVLLVGHNGIGKALIAAITGKKSQDIPSIENLHNTSVSIFEIDEDKNHKIHLFNCTKHL
ncbi:MAG: histidine phosphatase family protein [Nanoarchaeota archaeon]